MYIALMIKDLEKRFSLYNNQERYTRERGLSRNISTISKNFSQIDRILKILSYYLNALHYMTYKFSYLKNKSLELCSRTVTR